jgi:hypothetical protein
MLRLFAVAALALTTAAPALAFSADTEALVSRLKSGKLIPGATVAELMRSAERWCYWEQEGACSWSDIYLEVDETGVTYEIGNAWETDISLFFTDTGVWQGNEICETGEEWIASVRATRISDGTPIGGRELWDIKNDVLANRGESFIDCFDYLFLRADPDANTVTLLQRHYQEGTYVPANDAEVSIHFDPDTAAALTWY